MESQISLSESVLKSAIQYNKDTIIGNLRHVEDVIRVSYEKGILTTAEKEHLDREGINKGNTARCLLLLEILLNKTDSQLHEFLGVLNNKGSQALASIIYSDIDEIKEGRKPMHGSLDPGVMVKYLQNAYLNNIQWSTVEAIPGILSIDLTVKEAVMRPFFKAKILNETTSSNVGFINQSRKNAKYKVLQVENFEDIFDRSRSQTASLAAGTKDQFIRQYEKNILDNLVVCIGDAGVGKTTLCHTIALMWATYKSISLPSITSSLAKFTAIFLIPIRNAGQGPIVEILTKLDLLEQNRQAAFHGYMSQFQNAESVLFILDGFDEIDIPKQCELYKLVQGKLYPGCSVMITARPESEIMKKIGNYSPKVKVVLLGTDQESAEKYVKYVLQDSEETKVQEFYDSYKEVLTDLGMNFVPLYLVLLIFCYEETEDVDGQAKYPDTISELFNNFLLTMIKRWLARLKNPDSAAVTTFIKNPLGKDSTIPSNIQRILFFIGKLCYASLIKHQYAFTSHEVEENFLSESDIQSSGLFGISTKGSTRAVYLKHKQFQEYLAGIYIANQQLELSSFSSIVRTQDLVNELACNNLLKALEFATGINPSLLCTLLTERKDTHVVSQSKVDGSIDIYYEASLFCQTASEILADPLCKFLLDRPVSASQTSPFYTYMKHNDLTPEKRKSKPFCNLAVYQKYLKTLASLCNTEMATQFLDKYYKIQLQQSDSERYIYVAPQSRVGQMFSYLKIWDAPVTVNLCLDQLAAELLSKFVITNVSVIKVRMWNKAFLDILQILKCFTGLSILDIVGVPISTEVEFEQASTLPTKKLEHISLYSAASPAVLPTEAVDQIIQQRNLKSLILLFTDLFTNMNSDNSDVVYIYLQELVIFDFSFNAKKLNCLCKLLASAEHLKSVTLWLLFTEDVEIKKLNDHLLALKELHKIGIHIAPTKHSLELLSSVEDMVNLTHLSVHSQRLMGYEKSIVQFLRHHPNLQKLTIWDYNGELKSQGYVFPVTGRQELQGHHVEVEVRTPATLDTWEDYLELYKRF